MPERPTEGSRTRSATDALGTRQLRASKEDTVDFSGSILALAHYFDCPRLLQRCEQVALLMLSDVDAENAWFDLRYAHRYQLQACKQRCLQLIAADKHVLTRPEYAEAKEQWDRRLLMDVMDALAARAAKAPSA